MTETTTRTYELGYILAPTVPETEVSVAIDGFKSAISALEGTILGEGAPEFIDLAYTMEKSIASKKYKYSQGYFGWIKFDATPEAMEGLKKTLDGIHELVRYILIKTSAENLVVFKKPKIEAIRESAGTDDEIVIDESEMDELKEDHELLPNVESDVVETPTEQAAPESVEKESE